jgi:hypothetical protein
VPPWWTLVLTKPCSKTPMWKMFSTLGNWSETLFGMSPKERRNRTSCKERGTD